tara:strand:- start:852 stop:1094 length:243 start_codon:yes stop_codon:yes gene_type:complete
MKAKDLIAHIQNDYQPDDEIIVAWWDIKAFTDVENPTNIKPAHWDKFVQHIGDEKDWSVEHEDIAEMYEEWERDNATINS